MNWYKFFVEQLKIIKEVVEELENYKKIARNRFDNQWTHLAETLEFLKVNQLK